MMAADDETTPLELLGTSLVLLRVAVPSSVLSGAVVSTVSTSVELRLVVSSALDVVGAALLSEVPIELLGASLSDRVEEIVVPGAVTVM